MNIACIAWGSLIWKPGNLPLASAWRPDGPKLPLEFARVSDGGELAVVLCPDAPATPTWWALLALPDLEAARACLREREQAAPEHPEWIGSIPPAPGADDGPASAIGAWLRTRALDACVWTALPPRWQGQEGRKPSADNAVAYLDSLTGDTRAHARDYVCRVPKDIDTPYRRVIEQQLGWRSGEV
ncbi:MAG: hypothetical protein JWQ72_146 [Polaromonas sp.]|nr:hypothetical protein [Polaromonas sp.]